MPFQFNAAIDLEKFLGDPFDEGNEFSLARAVELDEQEQYPERACDMLNEWGLHHYYVPESFGGKLDGFDGLFSLMRVVARRDFTAALSHATTAVASSIVWLMGDEDQKRRVAEVIKSGGEVGIVFHEKEHGNDLLACEVEAKPTEYGYALSGEKWVVGKPRRSKMLIIYAKTGVSGDPRGFSLFLLDKDKLPEANLSYMKKFKTHGVRGHEISGIRFDNCPVPESSVITKTGLGLELALKSSQLTRLFPIAWCLGSVDTALRVVLNFARGRKLYSGTVFSIPHARSLLVNAFVDLLTCECVGLAAVRALHVATEQMSVWASAAKYFVPSTLRNTMRSLAKVLGARHYLREGHCSGVFQKILRDIPFASVSHYSSVITLSHLTTQIQSLAEGRRKRASQPNHQLDTSLEAIFSLRHPLPSLDPSRLSLYNRGRDLLIEALPHINDLLLRLGNEPDCQQVALRLSELTNVMITEMTHQQQLLCGQQARAEAYGRSAEGFELAARYSAVHAAAACVRMWIENREEMSEGLRRGEWVVLAVEKVLGRRSGASDEERSEYVERVAQEMVRLYDESLSFSFLPFQLASKTNPAR